MIRAPVTKFKRACALAQIPRILRGEFSIPPCNFDKISAIFMKSKSTTSGSKDDEDEKCKKCKRLIELAFGPEKPSPEDAFEKIEIAKIPVELQMENITQTIDTIRPEKICEKDNRISAEVTMSREVDTDDNNHNIVKVTKGNDEDFKRQVEFINEPPLFQSFKGRKNINIDRPTPVMLSNIDSKKQSSGDINMLEMLAKQRIDTSNGKVLNEIDKLGISQHLLEDMTNKTSDNKDVSTDKSNKDTLESGKVSDIDLGTQVLEKDHTKMSKRNFINRRAMKHLALHMGTDDISKNIVTSEVKMKKYDEDSTNKLTGDRHFRIELEIPFDCKKIPERETDEVKLKKGLTSNVLTDDRFIRTDHEVPLDTRIRTQHDTLLEIKNKPGIKEKFNTDSHSIVTNDRNFRTDSTNSPCNREILPQTGREKEKLGQVNINTQEPVITTDQNNNNEPAVLVKQCEDPDGFRITPETPVAQTLAEQLIALNLKIQEAIGAGQTAVVNDLKNEEQKLSKEAARQNLTRQIDKIFKDDRMPKHLFTNLTVVSKGSGTSEDIKVVEPSAFNKSTTGKIFKDDRVPPHMFQDLTVLSRHLPRELELKKSIEKFYEQEHDPELVKPDRYKYNSPNDDLVADRDYSLELDPRVVIKEFEILPPMYTEPNPPQSPNYSNYFNNQGNMFPQNMPPLNMPSQNPYNTPSKNPYNMPSQNPYNSPPPYGGPQNMQFYNITMASEVMPVNVRSNNVPHDIANQMPSSFNEKPQIIKTAEDHYNETKPNRATPNANIYLPHTKMSHETFTSTASESKLTENVASSYIYARNTVTHSGTGHRDNPYIKYSTDNSNQVHTGSYLKDFSDKLEEKSKKGNKIIEMKGSTTDKQHGNVKDNLKRSIMPGLTPETAPFKVMSESMETPIKVRTDCRKIKGSNVKAKPFMKGPKPEYGFQSKATVRHWLDKGTITLKPHNASITAQESDKFPMPAIHPNMTLSEMLKNVRERARLEMCQQIVISNPARKLKPTRGSCKKPKPPCPPPQKKCPSSKPKVCPQPECPKPPPPPKPCKPACPDPCATPKCPPPPKKDPCPCAKLEKTERGSDVLGLVVTLGPMAMTTLSTVNYKHLDQPPEDFVSNSFFKEELLLYGSSPDTISLTKLKDPLMQAVSDIEDDVIVPDLLHSALIFPKNYEPWTPIPSWPIPKKVEERKLVCPKEGCKVRRPPLPGAPCDTIHHPCAGFPHDKKIT